MTGPVLGAAALGSSWYREPVFLLAALVLFGFLAQWIAWRVRIPSILLLLVTGILLGPVLELLQPDELFGDLLAPLISISVAIILYEGGLSLRFAELRAAVGRVVRNLVTLGALVTWVLAAAGARLILDLEMQVAVLLGAVLTVTGPTVIQPLLRHIRPGGPVGRILKWEGIVIDPIGALLSVLVFEAVLSEQARQALSQTALAIVKTAVAGGLAGGLGAFLLVLFLHRYWVPDYLQIPLSLSLVMTVDAVSNHFQAESGLFAVTLMGLLVANQRWTEVFHIIEFKENIRVLLISTLFLLLAARLEIWRITDLGWQGLLFLAALILLVRPISVLVSTLGSGLPWRDRTFLMWMAPRGIVAAAVSSIFALRLETAGIGQAPELVSVTFLVILGTVAFYGLTAPFMAVRLGISESDPQGLLMVGADRAARAMARVLKKHGFAVQLVDTNRENANEARMEGISAYSGNVLGDSFFDDVDLGGIGRLLALTPSDWVNGLAAQRFSRSFGKANVYRLPPRAGGQEETDVSQVAVSGRPLFAPDISHEMLEHLMEAGAEVKATRLSEEFDWDDYRERYGADALPLFVIGGGGKLRVVTAEEPVQPTPGETVLGLVFDEDATSMEQVREEVEDLTRTPGA